MLDIISKSQALKIILGLQTAIIIFHLLIIIRIVPYEFVWAGNLKSINEMYVFEFLSVLINLILIAVLLLKGSYIKSKIGQAITSGILWFFVFLFGLNTIGNLMAKSIFEKTVFTPSALISAILIWIIIRDNKTSTS